MSKTYQQKEETDSEKEYSPEPKIYQNSIDYILNVPIETDEDLASLGHIYTD